jgi:hypothetical protein
MGMGEVPILDNPEHFLDVTLRKITVPEKKYIHGCNTRCSWAGFRTRGHEDCTLCHSTFESFVQCSLARNPSKGMLNDKNSRHRSAWQHW